MGLISIRGGSPIEPFFRHFLEILAPAAIQSIDPANLLFHDAGIPLWMKKHDIVTLSWRLRPSQPLLLTE